MPYFNVARVFVIGLLTIAFTGCEKHPEFVPVSGKVYVDNVPLTLGDLMVVPNNGKPAYATIQPDGSFTLMTRKEGDGVVLGTHKVSISAIEVLQGQRAQKYHIPQSYSNPSTSGVTLEVTGPTSDARIDLTWNGGKAFVKRVGSQSE